MDSAPLTASATQRTVVGNRFIEGDQDMNQPDNCVFQPKTGNHYVIEDNPNGDIFTCLPDGADRNIKTDGCIKVLSVKDSSAEPTGVKFTADRRTAYLSIQHSSDGLMKRSTTMQRTTSSRSPGSEFHSGSSGSLWCEPRTSCSVHVACAPKRSSRTSGLPHDISPAPLPVTGLLTSALTRCLDMLVAEILERADFPTGLNSHR